MKKFLALVLALVMTMSLVTISAGAEGFTDDSKITYEEAVDVVSAAGIVSGYENGSFNPTGTLTRGAAAKIICNMILGPTTAEALVANNAPYSDVPADHVFAGYIAYCANEGIISGYADGTFRPAATLTGYAFMKMLLGALGYDADVEGYTGSNWSIAVAKRALNIGLDAGLVGEFAGAKALTREEACLYAFNTMKADMVDYGTKSSIQVGDITVTTSAEASVVTNDPDDANIWDEEEDDEIGVLQFAEKYFEDLSVEGDTDAFGRPANSWDWDGDDIGTYTKAPKYTFTLDSFNFDVETEDELKELVRDITSNKKLDYDGATKLYINGWEAEVEDLEDYFHSGTTVELFCTKNMVTTAVVAVPFALQITDVDDDLSKTETKKGATYEVELSSLDGDVVDSYYDEHDTDDVLPGFDAETYVEDAVLVVYPNFAEESTDPGYDADDILVSYVAEEVEGVLKTKAVMDKSSKLSLNLDGTKYPVAVAAFYAGVIDLVAGSEQNIYLTEEGYVVGVIGETGENIDNVYYVTGVYQTTSTKGTTSYYAETVALDGTTADLKLETGDALIDFLAPAEDEEGEEAPTYAEVGWLYILTDTKDYENKAKDGKYDSEEFTYDDVDNAYNGYFVKSFGTLDDDVKTTSTSMKVDDVKAYLDGDTAYVAIEGAGDTLEVKANVGGMNLSDTYLDANNDTQYADVIVLAHVDDAKLATNVIHISGDLDAVVNSDTILYVPVLGDYELGDETDMATVWFMADQSTDLIEVDNTNFDVVDDAGYFYSFTEEEEVYTLDEPGDELDADIDEDSTGYYYEAIFTAETVYGTTLSYDIFEDVDFSDAKVIDTRYDASEYDKDIDSAADLKKAAATEGIVVAADVYVDDGEIVFVAVLYAGAGQ